MKSRKYIPLVCALAMVGVISTSGYAAISFSSAKKVQPNSVSVVSYMDENNPSLKRALDIHNLLHEMPDLMDMVQTSDDMKRESDITKKQSKSMNKCYAKKMADVFKDPDQAWGKMLDAYAQKRQSTTTDQGRIQTNKGRIDDAKKNMSLSRDIMMDVYANPSNWGDVKQGQSFPLWQDQVSVFEKEWNDFYNKMNSELGVPLSGRPRVDEKTRQNAQKYDVVLKAHQDYLKSLNSKKTFKGVPPKAPKALPDWKEVVYIDPQTNEVYPEMPAVWKDPSMREELVKENPEGELARVFNNGDVSKPTETAFLRNQSDLEKGYNMRLMVDSLVKSTLSLADSFKEIQQDFVQRVLALNLGVNEDIDLSDGRQYSELQKQLRSEKDRAIAEAQKYIEKLEKQDAEHPELVKRRQKIQDHKQALLSESAQNELRQMNGIIQISQMSPVMQQKMVVAALKKDVDALSHLTETNAMEVDQMMQESLSTRKLMVGSQQQMKTAFDKQIRDLPSLTQCD